MGRASKCICHHSCRWHIFENANMLPCSYPCLGLGFVFWGQRSFPVECERRQLKHGRISAPSDLPWPFEVSLNVRPFLHSALRSRIDSQYQIRGCQPGVGWKIYFFA